MFLNFCAKNSVLILVQKRGFFHTLEINAILSRPDMFNVFICRLSKLIIKITHLFPLGRSIFVLFHAISDYGFLFA